mgnify:CR=1 FL=1|tara:strand:- start:1819 stop:2121 length:303 start_codon:yes stop_codon:yes gene_type:complete
MNSTKIIRYLGIFIFISSLIYELSRKQIDLDKGLFSINVGLFLVLFSFLLKNKYFLTVIFSSYVIYIILSFSFKNELSVNQFIFILLALSMFFKYILNNK